jgi:hypothetical protein
LLLRPKWPSTNGRKQQHNREGVPHLNAPPWCQESTNAALYQPRNAWIGQ